MRLARCVKKCSQKNSPVLGSLGDGMRKPTHADASCRLPTTGEFLLVYEIRVEVGEGEREFRAYLVS